MVPFGSGPFWIWIWAWIWGPDASPDLGPEFGFLDPDSDLGSRSQIWIANLKWLAWMVGRGSDSELGGSRFGLGPSKIQILSI